MSINIDEIKTVLYNAPARFAKIFFTADILILKNKDVKITIKTTLDYYGVNLVYHPKQSHLKISKAIENERKLEKFHQTGLALGALEYYLKSQSLSFTQKIEYLEDEIIAEYYIS